LAWITHTPPTSGSSFTATASTVGRSRSDGVFGRIADSFVTRVSARSLRASLQTLKGLIEGDHEATAHH
jgi:hypothetical protein